MIASIEQTLSYANAAVVERICHDLGVDEIEGEQIFRETKRWLWTAARHHHDWMEGNASDRSLVITPALAIIDEGWHTFLLFSASYEAFCLEHFEAFVHHTPEPKRRSSGDDDGAARALLRRQMSYLHDLHGASVLRHWYADLPTRYPMRRIVELRHAAGIAALAGRGAA